MNYIISCFSGRAGTVQERSWEGQRSGSSCEPVVEGRVMGSSELFYIPWVPQGLVLDPDAES